MIVWLISFTKYLSSTCYVLLQCPHLWTRDDDSLRAVLRMMLEYRRRLERCLAHSECCVCVCVCVRYHCQQPESVLCSRKRSHLDIRLFLFKSRVGLTLFFLPESTIVICFPLYAFRLKPIKGFIKRNLILSCFYSFCQPKQVRTIEHFKNSVASVFCNICAHMHIEMWAHSRYFYGEGSTFLDAVCLWGWCPPGSLSPLLSGLSSGKKSSSGTSSSSISKPEARMELGSWGFRVLDKYSSSSHWLSVSSRIFIPLPH